MLGIAHEGVALALLWVLLDRGNSNTAERMALSEQFLELFEGTQVAELTADREESPQGLVRLSQAPRHSLSPADSPQ